MHDGIDELVDEVRLLWHAMVKAGERLHRREPVTLGMRGVLEFLERNGPATVPHVARSRNVTRQHVQALVNALVDRKLAALEPNPAHRRSVLVRLTEPGKALIGRMRRREGGFFERIDLGASEEALRSAARTLRSVRTALGSGA